MSVPDDRPILFLNSNPRPHMTGAEVFMLSELDALAGEDIPVSVVAMPDSSVVRLSKLITDNVESLDLNSSSPFSITSELLDIYFDNPPRIIVGTSFYTNMLASILSARFHENAVDLKVVNTVHCEVTKPYGAIPHKMSHWMKDKVDAFCRNNVDHYIALGSTIASQLECRGIDPAKISAVPTSVNVEALQLQAEVAEPFPELTAFKGDHPLIGFVGVFEEEKGLDNLLDAFRIMMESTSPASSQDTSSTNETNYNKESNASDTPRLAIIGEGSLEKHLTQRIENDVFLTDHVKLFEYHKASQVMPHFDLYCLPSINESINITVLEAMALNVPVVAIDAGGIREAVTPGETGAIVKPHDPQALADALQKELQRKATLRASNAEDTQVQQAFQNVQENFSWEKQHDQLLHLYRELLQTKAEPQT